MAQRAAPASALLVSPVALRALLRSVRLLVPALGHGFLFMLAHSWWSWRPPRPPPWPGPTSSRLSCNGYRFLRALGCRTNAPAWCAWADPSRPLQPWPTTFSRADHTPLSCPSPCWGNLTSSAGPKPPFGPQRNGHVGHKRGAVRYIHPTLSTILRVRISLCVVAPTLLNPPSHPVFTRL